MTTTAAGPFCKAVGGKTHLLWRLMELAPKQCAVYWEPFAGGGAMFWAMAREGRYRRAVISDANLDLIRTWLAIQRNYRGVLRELDGHKHTKAHYLRVRAKDSAKMTDESAAARFLFLMKAGYNGLWRVNAGGGMNVPFGKQPKMVMFADPQRIKACAEVLNAKPVTIVHGDFEDVTRKVRLGDFCYVDSPYAPLSKTSAFTSYTAGGFTDDDQRRLAAWFGTLSDRGMRVLLSNSSCEFVDKLYHRHSIERVFAKRSINSDATKRGDVREVLVKSRALVNE